MSKHTPGPWTVSDELTTDKHFAIDIGHDVSGCVLVERHVEGHDESDEPNARLIAASPEMLEALKLAHMEIIRLLNEGDFKKNITLDLGYIVDAIAKAEGRK